ncbi:MAG: PKD domain-containing protein [Bacteroidia bacterium]
MAKKTLNFFLLIAILMICSNTFATKRYWSGRGANKNWNNTANWGSASNGTGASVPTTTDSVYFDGAATGKICSMEVTMSILYLKITGDTLKQNAFGITVGTSGVVMSGGTFKGGSINFTDNGSFSLTGGSFTSTSAILTIKGTTTIRPSTFIHNNGETSFTGTFTINASTTFYKCTFAISGTYTIDTGTVIVNNVLKTTGGVFSTGKIHAHGDITQTGANTSYATSTGTFVIDGTGTQNINGISGAYTGFFPNIEINKPSDTLYLKNNVVVGGKWKYVTGTINDTRYTSALCFAYGASNSAEGHVKVHNLVLADYTGSCSLDIPSGDTLTVLTNITTAGPGIINHTGVISLKGDFTINATSLNATTGGTGTLLINGTGPQHITGNSTKLQGGLSNIVINKSSDTLHLKRWITVNGDWTYQNGTIDSQTDTSTIIFGYKLGGRTISGSCSLNNVSFYANNTLYNSIPSTNVLTVLGKFIMEGDHVATFNNGKVYAQGDIYLTDGLYNTTYGTGTIVINGTGNQTFHGNSSEGLGHATCNIKIDKATGTLTLKDYINIGNNLTYAQGTIDDSTYTNEVVFLSNSARTIKGKASLRYVTFYTTNSDTISSGDTLTVKSVLKYTGAGAISIVSGIIKVTGDITDNNSAGGSGGAGTLYISGTGNQTITGYTASTGGFLCNVKINKPSGTLSLANYVGVRGDWNYINGAIDPSTSTVVFNGNLGRTISGTDTLYNVLFSGTATNTNTIGSSDVLYVKGTLQTTGTGAITINTGTIKAKGDITISNTITGGLGGGTGLITICGTGDQILTGNGISGTARLCNVKVDKPSGKLTLSSFFCLGASDWTYTTSGSVDPGTSTLTFFGNGNLNGGTLGASMNFYNVRVQSGTVTLTGLLNVKNDLTVDASRVLTANSYDINVGRNFTAASGTFNYGTGTVTFNGNAGQYITSVPNFYNLTVNKLAGKVYLANSGVAVNHALTLTKGVLVDGYASHILSVADNVTCSGGSDTSYVSGIMKKVGNDAFSFPLGDTTLSTGAYHPLTITAPSLITDTYTARYRDSIQGHGSTTDTTIFNLSNCEYWNLARTVGTSNVSVTLGWNTNSYSIISAADTRIAYWDSGTSTWKDKGGVSSTGTGSVGTTKTSAAQSSFGDFTLALTKDVTKYFRSTATGNWENTSTWQMSSDNSTWVTSTATPYYNSNLINIQSSHTVTINESVKIDQTTVNGTLVYGNTAGSTLTINDGSGTDLTVNGTFKDSGPNDVSWLSSSTWVMGSTGTLVRTNSTSSDNWRDRYQSGISTIPSTSTWIIRKTGTANPLLTSIGGMYYPNLTIENSYSSAWTMSGSSIFTGSSDYPRIKGNLDIGGSGTNTVSFSNQNTNATMIPVCGNLTIENGNTLQSNGTGFNLQGNLTKSGNFSGAIKILFSGSDTAQVIAGGAITGIKSLAINKSAGYVKLNTSLTVDSILTLTKGYYDATSGNSIVISSGASVSGGSDSSYVSGAVKKVGNTAFTFPLGDKLLLTGAYHPLKITAPSSSSDAFSGQYYAANQTYGDSLQADSLESISTCEYWKLTRNAGSSVVVPSIGWNINSCNIDDYDELRLSGWNGTRWMLLGYTNTVTGSTGIVNGHIGLNLTTVPLVIANSSIEVLNNTTPVTDAGTNQTICPGTQAQLQATGADAFSWYPSEGLSNTAISNPVATPDTTKYYYVIGTNGNNSVLDSVLITVRTAPVLTVSDSVYKYCAGGSATLSTSGTGTFLWQPSTALTDSTISSPVANPSISLTYIVQLTDANNCISRASIDVLVNDVYVTTPDTVTIEIGDSLQLIASSNTTDLVWTPSSYLTDSTSNSPIATPTVTTDYSVTASLDSCTTTSDLVVNVLEQPLAAYTYSFPGLSVQFNTSNTLPAAYAWDFGDSGTSTSSSPLHTYSTAGSYTVCLTVTNTLGSASLCDTIDVQ